MFLTRFGRGTIPSATFQHKPYWCSSYGSRESSSWKWRLFRSLPDVTLALLVGLASPDYSQALFVACRTKFAQRSSPLNLYHLVILNYELHGDSLQISYVLLRQQTEKYFLKTVAYESLHAFYQHQKLKNVRRGLGLVRPLWFWNIFVVVVVVVVVVYVTVNAAHPFLPEV